MVLILILLEVTLGDNEPNDYYIEPESRLNPYSTGSDSWSLPIGSTLADYLAVLILILLEVTLGDN